MSSLFGSSEPKPRSYADRARDGLASLGQKASDAQFEAEGRGAQFVDANGTLVWPRENVLYSPYYPAGAGR